MPYINQIVVMGHLGRDAETKATNTGKKNTTFTLATSESWLDNNNQWQSKSTWHNVSVWGKLAEYLEGKSLKKGELVYVQGKLTTREYTDKNNNKKTFYEILADKVLAFRKDQGSNATAPQQAQSFAQMNEEDDYDLPF